MWVEINLKIQEKEFQDLMETFIRRKFVNNSRINIFREIYVHGSYADIVSFSPFQTGEINVYELKMGDDKDSKRLLKQVNNYLKVADNVYVLVFDGYPCVSLPKEVNIVKISIDKYDMISWDYIQVADNNKGFDTKSRKDFISQLTQKWSDKVYYNKKIIDYLDRRLIREEKKRLKEAKLLEQKKLNGGDF